jgi:hypothetical protein
MIGLIQHSRPIISNRIGFGRLRMEICLMHKAPRAYA